MHVDNETRLRHMLDVVWQTVSEDLPGLVIQLDGIVHG